VSQFEDRIIAEFDYLGRPKSLGIEPDGYTPITTVRVPAYPNDVGSTSGPCPDAGVELVLDREDLGIDDDIDEPGEVHGWHHPEACTPEGKYDGKHLVVGAVFAVTATLLIIVAGVVLFAAAFQFTMNVLRGHP
jgi:hypothetical protein